MARRKKKKGKGRHKFEKVLSEFKHGTLRSSSGGKVTSRKQALAIAFSEARQAGARLPKKRKKIRKKRKKHG